MQVMMTMVMKKMMILLGKFNARTGVNPEFILDDNDKFFDLPDDYVPDDLCTLRNSEDRKTVNKRGKNLVDMCTALNLRIFNGRTIGDLKGKKTCFKYNGSSVVRLCNWAN